MSFHTITACIEQELGLVEQAMQQAQHTPITLIGEITSHIAKGGKRIRPAIILLIANALNYQDKKRFDLAVIIEFIHTATLLHDDVIDHADMRRNQTSANQIWGNEASILVGDFLYSRAFEKLVSLNSLTLSAILANVSNGMAEGEVLQLMNRHNHQLSVETYFQIIEAKTAKLFEASAKMIATLANASPTCIEAMSEFGRHLGLAFQLVDDALDYQGDAHILGKRIGEDLLEGKMTLPLIYGKEQATNDARKIIEKAIATGNGTDALSCIQTTITQTGAVDYTLSQAKQHIAQAQAALQYLPSNVYTDGLMQLTTFVTARQY